MGVILSLIFLLAALLAVMVFGWKATYMFVVFWFTLVVVFVLLDATFEFHPYSWDAGTYLGAAYEWRAYFFGHVADFDRFSRNSLSVGLVLMPTVLFGAEGKNALASVFLCLLVAILSIVLFGRGWKVLCGSSAPMLALLLYPSMMLFSGQITREPFLWLFFALVFYVLARRERGHGSAVYTVFWVSIALGGMWLFRFPVAVAAMVALILAYSPFGVLRTILFSGSVVAVFDLTGLTDFVGAASEYIDVINTSMTYRAQGGGAYLEGMRYNNLLDMAFKAPLRVVHFASGPFLWNTNGVAPVLAAIERVVMFGAAGFLAFRWRDVCDAVSHSTVIKFALLFGLTGIVLFSLVDSNYGTAQRHRIVFDMFYWMFVAYIYRAANRNKVCMSGVIRDRRCRAGRPTPV